MFLTSNTKVWQGVFTVLFILTIFILLFFYFSNIFITFIIGFVLIFLTERLIKVQKSRALKSKLSKKQIRLYLTLQLVFWSIITIFVIVNSTSGLSNAISEILNDDRSISQIYTTTYSSFFPAFINENIFSTTNIELLEIEFLQLLSGFFSSLGFIAINGLLIIPLMFHLYFKKRHQILERLASLFDKRYHDIFKSTSLEIGKQLRDFFSAKVVESIVVGSICCLGFYFAGLDGWLLLGLLAGFLNIVPYLGPIIGAVPPLLVSAYDSPIVSGIVLLTIVIAQLVDNFYLIPFMIPSKVKINSLLSVVLILVGAQVIGVMGMVFAIPIYLVYKIVLVESYKGFLKVFNHKT